jgi:hypothetical protein
LFISQVSTPAELLVELYVRNGMLSFYPPPGRPLLNIKFYQNTTSERMAENYKNLVLCPGDQKACMQNRSTIIMRALLSQFQSALKQRFLSYIANSNFYGQDSLHVWISDQGFTDQSYKDVRTASSEIPIVVLPVNDNPTVSIPSNTAGIQYVTDMPCRADFMNPFRNVSQPNSLDGLRCPYPSSSAFPPSNLPPISVADVDVDDVKMGNVTVNIQIQAQNAGQMYIEAYGESEIGALPDVTYYERFDEDGTTTLILWGKVNKIVHVLRHLFFDCAGGFAGYAPISIRVRSVT